MSDSVVDFRKPARVSEDIGQMLTQWQHRSRDAVEVRFGRLVPSELKMGVLPPTPVTGEDLRVSAKGSIVYRVDIVETGAATLLILDRPLALALAAEMLGAGPEKVPEDRTLTEIETTCLDFLVEELTCLIVASQTLTPARSMKVVGKAKLKELHSEFPTNVTNANVAYRVELPYGHGMIRWIIPQAVTLDMVASSPTTLQSNGRSREALKRLVLDTPSQMSVCLGESHVQLSKLRTLSPGDIIVLDQKIDEPLTAKVGGYPMFHGWCGKHGKQQVFQIGELFESDNTSHVNQNTSQG